MFIWSINTSLYLHVRVCEIQEFKTENDNECYFQNGGSRIAISVAGK